MLLDPNWTYPKRYDQRIIKLWTFAFSSYPSLSNKEQDRHEDGISDEAASLGDIQLFMTQESQDHRNPHHDVVRQALSQMATPAIAHVRDRSE